MGVDVLFPQGFFFFSHFTESVLWTHQGTQSFGRYGPFDLPPPADRSLHARLTISRFDEVIQATSIPDAFYSPPFPPTGPRVASANHCPRQFLLPCLCETELRSGTFERLPRSPQPPFFFSDQKTLFSSSLVTLFRRCADPATAGPHRLLLPAAFCGCAARLFASPSFCLPAHFFSDPRSLQSSPSCPLDLLLGLLVPLATHLLD